MLLSPVVFLVWRAARMQGPLEQLMCSLLYVLQRKSNNQSCEQNGTLTEVML